MESGVRKALGKGIEALFPAPQERRVPAGAPSELAVPVHEIVPNPEQPRRHFDDEALSLLADSIRRHGLLQPLVARRIAGRYELIAGERRLRAALRAGLEGVTEQVSFAREIVTRRLTKSETERLAAARRARQGKQPAAGPAPDLHLRGLAEELTRGFGTRVRITRQPRGGSIEIEFYSDAELDRLIDRLRQALPRA